MPQHAGIHGDGRRHHGRAGVGQRGAEGHGLARQLRRHTHAVAAGQASAAPPLASLDDQDVDEHLVQRLRQGVMKGTKVHVPESARQAPF